MFFKRIDRADFRLSLNFNTNVKNITPISIVNSLLTSLERENQVQKSFLRSNG